jgi:hypothetical protein
LAVEAQPAGEAGAPVGAAPGGDVKEPTTGQPAREPEQTSERQSLLGRLVRADDRGRLWPWGSTMAFLAAALLFLILAAVLYGTSRGVGWPARRDGGALVYLVTLVGLTPVWLLLLDSLSPSSRTENRDTPPCDETAEPRTGSAGMAGRGRGAGYRAGGGGGGSPWASSPPLAGGLG